MSITTEKPSDATNTREETETPDSRFLKRESFEDRLIEALNRAKARTY